MREQNNQVRRIKKIKPVGKVCSLVQTKLLRGKLTCVQLEDDGFQPAEQRSYLTTPTLVRKHYRITELTSCIERLETFLC